MKEHGSPQELRAAAEAADALISRIEDRIADHLAKKDDLDEKAAFYEIVEMLETSQEITALRMALGREPTRWGDDSPLGAPGHTG